MKLQKTKKKNFFLLIVSTDDLRLLRLSIRYYITII